MRACYPTTIAELAKSPHALDPPGDLGGLLQARILPHRRTCKREKAKNKEQQERETAAQKSKAGP